MLPGTHKRTDKNYEGLLCEIASWTYYNTIHHVLCCSSADVNAQNALGKKPLHLAAAEGHAQTVEALLAAGTKVRPSRV